MNKQEAIQAMEQGKKVRHRYFSSDEWVTIKDGKIHTEEGYSCTQQQFWGDRHIPEWEKDWELVESEPPAPAGEWKERFREKYCLRNQIGIDITDQVIDYFDKYERQPLLKQIEELIYNYDFMCVEMVKTDERLKSALQTVEELREENDRLKREAIINR